MLNTVAVFRGYNKTKKKTMIMKLLFPKSHVLIEQNYLSRLLLVDIEYGTNLPAILHFNI